MLPLKNFHKRVLSGREAFTLIEVLITMLVLGIGIMGLEALFTLQIRSNTVSKKFSIANGVALDLVEKVKNAPYRYHSNSVSVDEVTKLPTEPCVLTFLPADTNYNKIVDCLRPDDVVTTPPGDPYNVFSSDPVGTYVSIGGIEVRREIIIEREDSPTYGIDIRKQIEIRVYWKDPLKPDKIHEIKYYTIRDRGIV